MDSKNDSIDYTPLVSKLAKSLLSSNDKDVDSKEMLAHNREFISMFVIHLTWQLMLIHRRKRLKSFYNILFLTNVYHESYILK